MLKDFVSLMCPLGFSTTPRLGYRKDAGAPNKVLNTAGPSCMA